MFTRKPQPLSVSLHQLRTNDYGKGRLKAHAQTVADMRESQIREEFISIIDKTSRHPLAVRRFIVLLMKLDNLHQIQEEAREKSTHDETAQ